MWNPDLYLRFADERSRPFQDLVARIDLVSPAAVVDLGCGPGNLTETLSERWPQASVTGLDSSPEMIERARASRAGERIEFKIADVRDYRPAADVDLVVTNAVLQWVPGHRELLRRWAGDLRPGACLAMQAPSNHDAPSHRLIRELCAIPRWSGRLAGVLRAENPVSDAVGYARLLRSAGCAADAWTTTYVHQLPAAGAVEGEHPVLTWLSGTGLRPVRAVLGDADWDAFRAELDPLLAGAYPAHDGVVDFPFERTFAIGAKR